MSLTNAEITRQARSMLRGAWKLPILASAVFMTIVLLLGCVPLIGWAAAVAVTGPLTLGYCTAYLSFVRTRQMMLSDLFCGFSRFANAFLAYLLRTIFILLWALLLIIPGIIASLDYAMTFFVLADNPGLEGLEALRQSKELMHGRRWKLFCLFCRFIGWALLGIVTLGIGFIWIVPYYQTSLTIFYEDVRQDGVIT